MIPTPGKGETGTVAVFLAWLCLAGAAFAQGVMLTPDGEPAEQVLSVPYAFYNEAFGVAAGYVYGVVGYPQKQATLLTTVMAGSRGSAMGFLLGRDIQIPHVERLFLDPVISVGYFGDAEAFIDGNPRFAGERAGSNESDEENYLEGEGWDNFFRMRLKYLLPVGQGRDTIIDAYTIEEGLLISEPRGGASLNPLSSGKCYIEIRPFYRWQQIEGDDADVDLKTNGLDVAFFWDNRDFFANPSKGNSLRLKYSRDFGLFDSNTAWTSLDGELDAYIPLGPSEHFRQRVIALDVWTSYSPTWDEEDNGEIDNRPPAYTGATLGGLWRMRGYPSQRFNDKAAVYYSAELRVIPEWNPFKDWAQLQKYLGVQWLQLVPFFEVGRVAPSWNVGELHSDMKWDAGFGLRLWAKGLVARVDTAVSEEGAQVQMMISQPFQF